MDAYAYTCACDHKQVPSAKSFRAAAGEVDKDFSYKFSGAPDDENGNTPKGAAKKRFTWAKENGTKMRVLLQVLQKEASRSVGGGNEEFRKLKARAIT